MPGDESFKPGEKVSKFVITPGDSTISAPSPMKMEVGPTPGLDVQIDVNVSITTSVATTIKYSAALKDTDSPEYAIQTQIIKKIFQAELEEVANNDITTLVTMTVAFFQSISQRNLRSNDDTTDITITAVYAVTVPQSTDLTLLEDAVTSLTTDAASNAISNSAGIYISLSAQATVSSSGVDWSVALTEVTEVKGIIHLIFHSL